MCINKYLIALLFLLFPSLTILFSQNDFTSDEITISLLTYSPGSELYSTFGHSAIRVIQTKPHKDYVYNYGSFDFNSENFYLNFIQGKLPYYLSKVQTQVVLEYTSRENRGIVENEFLLGKEEKINLVEILENNYRPENREYYYDFFYDNCATRIMNVIDSATNNRFHKSLPGYYGNSFTRLIQPYIKNRKWPQAGIMVCLGMASYKKANFEKTIFLPDYLKRVFENYTDQSTKQHLLGSDTVILEEKKININKAHHLWLYALPIFFVITITLFELKKRKQLRMLNFVLYLPIIITGILLLIFWGFSEHLIYKNNFNVLWANPLWLFLFYKRTNRKVFSIIKYVALIVFGLMFLFYTFFYFTPIILVLFVCLFIKTLSMKFYNKNTKDNIKVVYVTRQNKCAQSRS